MPHIPVGIFHTPPSTYGLHRYWRVRLTNSGFSRVVVSQLRMVGATNQQWSGQGADSGSWTYENVSDGLTPTAWNSNGSPISSATVNTRWTAGRDVRGNDTSTLSTVRLLSADVYLKYDAGSGQSVDAVAVSLAMHGAYTAGATDFQAEVADSYEVAYSDDNTNWTTAWSGGMWDGWANSATAFADLVGSGGYNTHTDAANQGLYLSIHSWLLASPRYASPLELGVDPRFYGWRFLTHNGGSVYFRATAFGVTGEDTVYTDNIGQPVDDVNDNMWPWYANHIDAFGAPTNATASPNYANASSYWQMYKYASLVYDMEARGGAAGQLSGFTWRGQTGAEDRSWDDAWVACSPDGWQWEYVCMLENLGGSSYWSNGVDPAFLKTFNFSFSRNLYVPNDTDQKSYYGTLGTEP